MKKLALSASLAVLTATAVFAAYQWRQQDGRAERPPANRAAASREASAPTLGVVWAPSQKGYGQVEPATVTNGGDPTGIVRHIRWRGWGSARATGTGTGWRAPRDRGISNSRPTPARVVAWDLGNCRGRLAYRRITWYFPSHGERFDPRSYIDICTGEYLGR